jgi:16S rRNA (guanine527-N7)-methyltransferase
MSLKQILLDNNIDNKTAEDFYKYYLLLTEWNEKINLTAITEEDEVAVKHFLDSLKAAEGIIEDGVSVIDVGTGAGFPGLPVKIANPDIKLTLVDSLNKRINFLNEVISSLSLDGVRTIHSRAEELGQNKDHREKYDLCVSRAVANLTTLCELCLPFVKVGGSFVSLKGPKAEEEVKDAKRAIELLGGELVKIQSYDLSDTDLNHNIVIIKKISHTPTKYPRSAPKPAKEPLK